MISETLRQQAASRLRLAVTREAYSELHQAIADYRHEVEAAVAAWHPGESAPVEIVREAMELTEWALRALRAARARTSQKLDQVATVLQYRPLVRPRPTWKLEG